MLELVTGDLLEADTEALVNAVNTEGVMSKGIALQFKRQYPDMFEDYQRACKESQVQPGRMHVYERPDLFNPRYIINFPTKRHWRTLSSIEDIKTGLTALSEEIRQRHIKSIALPALACGNGDLDWREVLPAIRSAPADLTDVRLLVYPPAGAYVNVHYVPARAT